MFMVMLMTLALVQGHSVSAKAENQRWIISTTKQAICIKLAKTVCHFLPDRDFENVYMAFCFLLRSYHSVKTGHTSYSFYFMLLHWLPQHSPMLQTYRMQIALFILIQGNYNVNSHQTDNIYYRQYKIDQNTQEVQMNAFYLDQDKTVCTFSA